MRPRRQQAKLALRLVWQDDARSRAGRLLPQRGSGRAVSNMADQDKDVKPVTRTDDEKRTT
jgi:hypothetical protein